MKQLAMDLVAGAVALAAVTLAAELSGGATLTAALLAAGTAVLSTVVRALNPEDNGFGVRRS